MIITHCTTRFPFRAVNFDLASCVHDLASRHVPFYPTPIAIAEILWPRVCRFFKCLHEVFPGKRLYFIFTFSNFCENTTFCFVGKTVKKTLGHKIPANNASQSQNQSDPMRSRSTAWSRFYLQNL